MINILIYTLHHYKPGGGGGGIKENKAAISTTFSANTHDCEPTLQT